jgi:hypothetical protein
MELFVELKTDYERADALVNLLVDRATGASPNEDDFLALRKYFVDNPELSPLLPHWFASKRSLNHFWGHIKNRYSTYAGRREYLWAEFELLLATVEAGTVSPAEDAILEGLKLFDSDEISRSWRRLLQRARSDPEGVITASRHLLETVLNTFSMNAASNITMTAVIYLICIVSVRKSSGLRPNNIKNPSSSKFSADVLESFQDWGH